MSTHRALIRVIRVLARALFALGALVFIIAFATHFFRAVAGAPWKGLYGLPALAVALCVALVISLAETAYVRRCEYTVAAPSTQAPPR